MEYSILNRFKKIKFNKTIIDIQLAFISLAVASIVQLLLRIILGRQLGASELGIYTIVFTIYLFGMQLATFGIGPALTKYSSEYDNDKAKIKKISTIGISSSFVIGLIMAMTLFLCSDIISTFFFHNPNMGVLLKITSLSFPFIAIQKSVLGALNGLREMTTFTILNVILYSGIFIFSIFLVMVLGWGNRGAVIGFVAPTIIVGLLSIFFIRDLLLPFSLSSEYLKDLLVFGFYTTIGNTCAMLNMQINILLLGAFSTTSDVGYYAVASTVVQGILLIPSSVQTITGPIVSNMYGKGNQEDIKIFIKRTIGVVFVIILIISIVLILVGKQIIDIVFTMQYDAAYIPLMILVIGHLIYSPYVAVGASLANIGKVSLAFNINLVTSIINIILSIMFIYYFGINGAAIATSVSLIITTLINLHIFKILGIL